MTVHKLTYGKVQHEGNPLGYFNRIIENSGGFYSGVLSPDAPFGSWADYFYSSKISGIELRARQRPVLITDGYTNISVLEHYVIFGSMEDGNLPEEPQSHTWYLYLNLDTGRLEQGFKFDPLSNPPIIVTEINEDTSLNPSVATAGVEADLIKLYKKFIERVEKKG